MAFTRFHDDPCRKIKQAQEITGPGRWVLDVPGNGDNMPFIMDPQIRAQKWGANLYTDFTDVNSSLLGIDRRISRDCLGKDEYNKNKSFLGLKLVFGDKNVLPIIIRPSNSIRVASKSETKKCILFG